MTVDDIGEHVVLVAALAPITHEGFAREEYCRARHLNQGQTQVIDGFVRHLDGREGQPQFGVDDRVDRQPVNFRLRAQLAN
jgi:hypothetical protein